MMLDSTNAALLERATTQDATDVDLLRMLAAALNEGLPEAVSYRVGPSAVEIHLLGSADCDQWQAWWTRHGGDDWTARTSSGPDALEPEETVTQHYAVGSWRGREVSLMYLTRTGGDR